MNTQTNFSRICMLSWCVVLWLSTLLQPQAMAETPAGAGPLDGMLLGKWTYRSFRNNPTPGTPVQDLLFGEGTMTITSAADGKLAGTLDFGPGFQMKITGSVTYGNPATLQFEATGVGESNRDWRYDYVAYLGFQFAQAVEQTPSLLGTIVRAQPHSGGQAAAGVTASWIAVKQGAEVAAPPMASAGAEVPKAPPMVAKKNSAKTAKLYLDDAARRAANPVPEPKRKVLESAGRIKLKASALVPPPPLPPPAAQPSLQPVTLTSQNGRLALDLVVDYNKTQLMIGKDQVHMRTYNGQLVGPVLRVKAGDTLAITVHNNLPDVPPPSPTFMNGHHDWNVTNLHFHGLHVAPQGTPDAESDNVLLEILPGQSQHYEVHIPGNHPAGTFWYHSHRHGSTAAQVASGMAGALIIERSDNVTNLDSIPEVAAAAQEVMVLQASPYLNNATTGIGEIELNSKPDGSNDAEDMFAPGNFFALKRYTTVNGLKIPTITIAPGEVRRLRLIASGQREFVQLRIARDADGNVPDSEQIPFNEVATDGLVTGRVTQSQDLLVQPGYRSDALIQPPANAAGTYLLVDMNSVHNAPAGATGADGSPERVSIIAKIVIAGPPQSMKLPDPAALLTQRLPDLQDSGGLVTRHAYYGIVVPPTVPPAVPVTNFFLSEDDIAPGKTAPGREFDPTQTRSLPFGNTEKWQIGSRNSGTIGVAHPFHIHINPFLITKVVDANGNDVLQQEFGGTLWRDTLAMKQGYTYTLLTQYLDFTGSYVNHCHILDHEDNGMMEKVTVYDPAMPPLSGPLGVVTANRSAEVPAVLKLAAGKPLLAVVVRSVNCGLCRDQIKAFEKAAQSPGWPKDLDLVFVAPDSVERINASKTKDIVKRGRIISDPTGTTLRSIDAKAMSEERAHGILMLDRKGNPIFKSASTEPLLDPASLQPHLDLLLSDAPTPTAAASVLNVGAQASIAVWGTPSANDDYITWAPTPCTIRLNSPQAQDVTVTLTNDPEGPIPSGRTTPLDGDVAFAAKLTPGQTAKDATLTLQLPRDGSPVSFFIAGKFPRSSTKDKDCVIEIHNASATGAIIGSQGLMVRVRKDHRSLTTGERGRFLEALDYLHRTATAPEGGDMYMHFVRMHKAAAFGLDFDSTQPEPQYPWPDLAHKGPGFISWHRAFLLLFERTLQENFPDVALPYWVMSDSSVLFSSDFLGANAVNGKGSTPAIFDTSNPLYGWTADIDGAVNLQLVRRGYGRNPGDQNFGPFFSDSDLFTLDHFSYYPLSVNINDINDPKNSFAAMLEMNPHNVGHNWVGPWMANCETSPRDPIFWVFHAGFDRQWAKWQTLKNRFNPDGSGDSFCPKGSFENPGALCDPQAPPPSNCDIFDPNSCVPVNHHLDDQLWPWNQKSGKAATLKGSYPEASMAQPFLKPFPAAPAPGLFPASPQAVTNGDMIDFMGKTTNRLPMGFCYDDTPYDMSDLNVPPPPLLALAIPPQKPGRLNASKSASMVLTGEKPVREKTVEGLRVLQEDAGAHVEDRRSALRILTQGGEKELPFKIAQSKEPKHAALKPEAIRLLSEFMMFDPNGRQRTEEVMMVLEKSLESADQETRSEALSALAGRKASKELLAMLRDSLGGKPGAKFAVEEAIHGLAASGATQQAAALIRPVLGSNNPEEQIAAVHALSRDPASLETRIKLTRDRTVPLSVRTAALQSLDPTDEGQFVQALSVATNPQEDVALRGHAVALLGVWARSSQIPLSPKLLSVTGERLSRLTDTGKTGLDPAVARTLRSLSERLSKLK